MFAHTQITVVLFGASMLRYNEATQDSDTSSTKSSYSNRDVAILLIVSNVLVLFVGAVLIAYSCVHTSESDYLDAGYVSDGKGGYMIEGGARRSEVGQAEVGASIQMQPTRFFDKTGAAPAHPSSAAARARRRSSLDRAQSAAFSNPLRGDAGAAEVKQSTPAPTATVETAGTSRSGQAEARVPSSAQPTAAVDSNEDAADEKEEAEGMISNPMRAAAAAAEPSPAESTRPASTRISGANVYFRPRAALAKRR